LRKALVVIGALSVFIASAIPAQAHEQVIEDANDTQGKLDIEKAKLIDNDAENERLKFLVRIFDRWGKRAIRPSRGNIVFQIKRSPESSYRLEVTRRPNGNLQSWLVLCTPKGCDYDNATQHPVSRPNKHSVETRIHHDDLEGVGNNVRWRAVTSYGTGCKGLCHHDSAPNGSLANHNVG
jgi:hypothetical protein